MTMQIPNLFVIIGGALNLGAAFLQAYTDVPLWKNISIGLGVAGTILMTIGGSIVAQP